MLTIGEQREFRQIRQELRKADRGFVWQLTLLQGALPVRQGYLLVAAAATAGLLRLVAVAGRLLRAYVKAAVLTDPIALMALADASWPGWGSGREPGPGASPASGRPQPDGKDL